MSVEDFLDFDDGLLPLGGKATEDAISLTARPTLSAPREFFEGVGGSAIAAVDLRFLFSSLIRSCVVPYKMISVRLAAFQWGFYGLTNLQGPRPTFVCANVVSARFRPCDEPFCVGLEFVHVSQPDEGPKSRFYQLAA